MTAMAGAAVIVPACRPQAARAQQAALPVVGYLHSGSPDPYQRFVAAFRKGLSETGYVEGQNVAIDYRWAEGHFEHLPTLADALVRKPVAVLVAQGGITTALAATGATKTIPHHRGAA
jgi:putative tryptophan/tyrosine transport system substrate-binding protein